MIVCIADPARTLETPAFLSDLKFDQFIRYRAPMDGTNPVDGCGCCCNVQAETVIAVLFAGESHSGTMDCISAHHVQDLSILFTSRSECSSPCGDIVKQILYCYLGARIPCTWLGLVTLSRFRRCQLAAGIVSLVCAARVSRSCGHT